MLDLDHPQTPHVFAASRQEDLILDYCKRLGVELEPFIQVNYNAYLHARNAFGGKPQRLRHILSDFHGSVAELLAKAVSQDGRRGGQGTAAGGHRPAGTHPT